eukprot:g3180.t1
MNEEFRHSGKGSALGKTSSVPQMNRHISLPSSTNVFLEDSTTAKAPSYRVRRAHSAPEVSRMQVMSPDEELFFGLSDAIRPPLVKKRRTSVSSGAKNDILAQSPRRWTPRSELMGQHCKSPASSLLFNFQNMQVGQGRSSSGARRSTTKHSGTKRGHKRGSWNSSSSSSSSSSKSNCWGTDFSDFRNLTPAVDNDRKIQQGNENDGEVVRRQLDIDKSDSRRDSFGGSGRHEKLPFDRSVSAPTSTSTSFATTLREKTIRRTPSMPNMVTPASRGSYLYTQQTPATSGSIGWGSGASLATPVFNIGGSSTEKQTPLQHGFSCETPICGGNGNERVATGSGGRLQATPMCGGPSFLVATSDEKATPICGGRFFVVPARPIKHGARDMKRTRPRSLMVSPTTTTTTAGTGWERAKWSNESRQQRRASCSARLGGTNAKVCKAKQSGEKNGKGGGGGKKSFIRQLSKEEKEAKEKRLFSDITNNMKMQGIELICIDWDKTFIPRHTNNNWYAGKEAKGEEAR